MTDMLRLCGVILLAALSAFTLRSVREHAGMAVALFAGMLLFFFAMEKLGAVIALMQQLAVASDMQREGAQIMVKLVGMAYVTEFAVQCCKDAGEAGLAAKAALCGKAMLLLETLPLIVQIGQVALSLTP